MPTYISLNSQEHVLTALNAPETPPGDYLPIAWPHKTAVWALWGPYKRAAAKHGIKPDWEHYQRQVVGLIEREAARGVAALDRELEKKLIAEIESPIESGAVAPNACEPATVWTEADEVSRRMGLPTGAAFEEFRKQFEPEPAPAQDTDWIEARLRGS